MRKSQNATHYIHPIVLEFRLLQEVLLDTRTFEKCIVDIFSCYEKQMPTLYFCPMWFLLPFFLAYSQPSDIGCLPYFHTSTHDVALVRI